MRASRVRIDCEECESGTVTYIGPPFGCSTRLRFIHVFGVYCVMSKTTHLSQFAMSAMWPR